jgi:ammonia channel protein AmtB
MSSAQRTLLAIYLGLLALCALLLVVGVFLNSATAQKYLVEVASDASKTVLGAAIGALSTLLNTTVSRQKAS